WGPLSYLRGAAEALPELTTFEIQTRFDDAEWQSLQVVSVLIANGRTAAGGFPLAAQAHPADGLMEVIVIQEGTFLDTASLAARFVLADYLDSPQVIHRRV